jgi:hypothetical protein
MNRFYSMKMAVFGLLRHVAEYEICLHRKLLLKVVFVHYQLSSAYENKP